MTLVEFLLALAVVWAGLGAMVVTSNSLRLGNADAQTRATLQALGRALDAFHRVHGRYPQGPTELAIRDLMSDRASGQIVADGVQLRTDAGKRPLIVDGYGQPIRYQPATGNSPADFVSAGPDGVFGEETSATTPSNTTTTDDRVADPAPADPRQLNDGHGRADNLYASEMESNAP